MIVGLHPRNVRTINKHFYTSGESLKKIDKFGGTQHVTHTPHRRSRPVYVELSKYTTEQEYTYAITTSSEALRARLTHDDNSLQEPSTINHRPPLTREDRYTRWLTACLAVKLLPSKLSATFRSRTPLLEFGPVSERSFSRNVCIF